MLADVGEGAAEGSTVGRGLGSAGAAGEEDEGGSSAGWGSSAEGVLAGRRRGFLFGENFRGSLLGGRR